MRVPPAPNHAFTGSPSHSDGAVAQKRERDIAETMLCPPLSLQNQSSNIPSRLGLNCG